jgi:hypothetical protein
MEKKTFTVRKNLVLLQPTAEVGKTLAQSVEYVCDLNENNKYIFQ